MISIIVCSINSNLFNTLSNSIENTIGLEYEIIKIDNSKEKLSIAQAYNKGASKARFKVLVFVHEDIIFHTIGWGEILISHFKSLENPGVLGVAGNSYLPISPSDWWGCSSKNRHYNYIKGDNYNSSNSGTLIKTNDSSPIEVYCLDGIFLALKKNVFMKHRFNENLSGFHGYDTSLSLRVAKNFKNYFIPDILMEHFSEGHVNKIYWVNTILACSEAENRNQNIKLKVEFLVFRRFVRKSIQFRVSPIVFFKSINSIIFQLIVRFIKQP